MYTKTNWVDNTTPIDKNNLNKIEQGIKNNDINIGEENYDNTKTYEVGDIVRYNEKIYKCITAITTAENFDISKWKQTNIVEIVQSEKSKIYELIEAISTPIVGEGENITLNDTAEKRFEKFDIEGNSEQETRSGKNKYNATINKAVNNVSSIADIQYFILNGTSSADSRVSFRLQTLKAGTYTVNLKYINGSFSNSANYSDHILRIWKGDSWNSFGTTMNVNSTDKSQVSMTFTLEEDTEISLGAYYRVTDIYNNIKYAYQIVEGSNSDFDFEPYGVSPSPDYPSEIKTVGSNGSVKVTKCNKNLFDKDKYRDINKWSNSQNFFTYCKLDEEDTKKFKKIITGNMYLKKTLQKLVFGISTTNNGSSFNNQYRMLDNGNIKNITYDFSDAKEIYLCIGNSNKINVNKDEINLIFDNYDIQFEEGSTATAYEEHREQSYIMPVQKEMLTDDYFDWDNEEEVHTWNKLVLDGTEDGWLKREVASEEYRFEFSLSVVALDNNQTINILCDKLKGLTADATYLKQEGISASTWVQIYLKEFSRDKTVEDFKNWLKEHPLTIYYKLATPERLKFTDEQKAVAIKLNNARTYKGVTHIYSNDAVSPNCYVEAAKDLTTLIQ